MKRVLPIIALCVVGIICAPDIASGQQDDAVSSLEELLRQVREQGTDAAAQNRKREQEFRQRRNEQKAILDRTRAELRSAEAHSVRLKATFDENERQLEELNEALRIRVGDMGELFGVVRQVAGDTKGLVEGSLISAQFADRSNVANELAQATELPSIADLRSLQALLLEEMIESGKVVRFVTEVEDATGLSAPAEVVRVGVFNAVSVNGYLTFDENDRSLRELPRPPAARFTRSARDFFEARGGETSMAIDPTRGTLLSLVIQSPGFMDQVNQGGAVGYTIIAMGIVGLLIALSRFVALQSVGKKMRRQLKSATASTDNPLGRILSVYEDSKGIATDTLDLKLDEAVLREIPALERFQATIKVFAGVAPLLGLLGTVVGMIKTFQSITLFGTGDPKLMADGISQALVTTVEGLIVAIPLVFLHSLVSGQSRALIEVLEEQSAGMIARRSEQASRAG
jgi:biopolymer transport protein ExbB